MVVERETVIEVEAGLVAERDEEVEWRGRMGSPFDLGLG